MTRSCCLFLFSLLGTFLFVASAPPSKNLAFGDLIGGIGGTLIDGITGNVKICGTSIKDISVAVITNCITSKFLDRSTSVPDSEDKEKWAEKQKDNKPVKDLLNELIITCGQQMALELLGVQGVTATAVTAFLPRKTEGPFDQLVCDLIKSVRTGQFEHMSILKVDECISDGDKVVDSECKAQLLGGETKFQLLKSVVTAVTSSGSSDNAATNIVAEAYRSCTSKEKSIATCFGFATVAYSCDSICRVAGCQLKNYAAKGNEACKKAVKTGCRASFAASDELCRRGLDSTIGSELSLPTCKPVCVSANESSRYRVLPVLLLVFTGLFL